MLWLTTRLLSLLRAPISQIFLPRFRVLDWFYYATPTRLLHTLSYSESRQTKLAQSLTSLPIEVLAMIVGELNWEDVLNLRKTCRLLKSVSQMREVWVEQYLRLSDSYEFTLPFHDHVDSMSSEELEYATLQWEQTEKQWMAKTSPPRRRTFKSPCGADTIFHLVRGGRWLLVTAKGGSMLAYDLNVPDGQPRTIIETGLNTDKGGVVVSYYPDSHPLSSLLITVICYDNRGCYAGCSIREVGSLGDTCPTATFHHSLKFPSSGCGPPFSLTGTHFAWFGSSCIEIYDWKRSSPLCHYKTCFQVDDLPRRMELLPESRVLCIYRDFLVIYAVPECNSIVDQENPTPQSPAQPLHTLRFPGPTFAITTASYSPVRVERDGSCVMLICPFEPMYKLAVPQTVHDDPTLTLVLSNFSRHLKSASIGFYRNHAEPRPKEVHRCTLRRGFVKDCQEPVTLPAENYTIYNVRSPFPLLDEISCRSILSMARNDRFDIFDYVTLSRHDSNS